MSQQHFRPGVAHDRAHLLAGNCFVTMNWALGAGRFVLSVGTLFQATRSVVHQLFTIAAQVIGIATHGTNSVDVCARMVISAIDARHTQQRFPFPEQSAFHKFSIR